MRRVLSIVMCFILTFTLLTGCDISSKHLEITYEENTNENISDWDSAEADNTFDDMNISTWDDAVTWSEVDDYSDWVASQILFADLTEDYPIVDCVVLDYASNGEYFDGDKIYTLVNDDFDVNSFIAKYATGSGVIVICVILNVATAGGSTPICCFIAGAADASVSYAIKGAAFNAAIQAISESLKEDASFEDVLYASLEGSADGYVWGSIYGTITGGFSSTYCFTEDTPVITANGIVSIKDIEVGDLVYSYDELTGSCCYQEVTQTTVSSTQTLVNINVNNTIISSTNNHPYLTLEGWKKASELSVGDRLYTCEGCSAEINYIEINNYSNDVYVYNLCIDNSHTFMIGEDGIIVHNRCNPNSKFAGTTRYFEEGSDLAKKYPDGVYIKPNGYPDFSPYAKDGIIVSFENPSNAGVQAGRCLRGDCYYDFKLANSKAFGIDSVSATPKGYTWHHCEDGVTMQLIPTDLHRAIGHDGGEKVIAQLLAEEVVIQ